MYFLVMTPEQVREFNDRFVIVSLIGLAIFLVLAMVGVFWARLRLEEWWENQQARDYWAGRQRDHQARLAELEAFWAAGELPVRITREYLTSDEFNWESDELEQRGYELAHQPFTNADGLIVVTYRLRSASKAASS
jgi:hypothetical protein